MDDGTAANGRMDTKVWELRTGDVKVSWGKGFEAGKPSCFEMFTLYVRLVYIDWNN